MNNIDDRKTCNLCQRKFVADRLEKHIEICKKQKEKKRKIFDSHKQRKIIDSSDDLSSDKSVKVKNNFPSEKKKNINSNSEIIILEKNDSVSTIKKNILNKEKSQESDIDYIDIKKNELNNEIISDKTDIINLKTENLKLDEKHTNSDSNNFVNSNKDTDNDTHIDELKINNLEKAKNLESTDLKKEKKIKPPSIKMNIKNFSNSETKKNITDQNKKKFSSNYVECTNCRRSFIRATAERHIPWCLEQQHRKSSTSLNNEEALARFRARNGYRANKNIKKKYNSDNNEKDNLDSQNLSLRKALSTIDGLDQIFKNSLINQSTLETKSISHGNLNKIQKKRNVNLKKNPINNIQSKTSSASSKVSTQNSYSNKEPTKSKVKALLNHQKKLQKQRMNSMYSKTPIMKFKEKFPNHNNKLTEFVESQQFKSIFKKNENKSSQMTNLPRTVPGVRTGGLSPTKEFYKNNQETDDANDLEKLRAKIKEMYLSSNENQSINELINMNYNYTTYSRESSSKLKSSKSVTDFNIIKSNDLEFFKTCHHCSTNYPTTNAKYCYECGARRLGSINSFVN